MKPTSGIWMAALILCAGASVAMAEAPDSGGVPAGRETCFLAAARHVRPGTLVKLSLADGGEVRGTLQGGMANNSSGVNLVEQDGNEALRVRLRDVVRMEYHVGGSLKAAPVLLGLLGGAALGLGIGSMMGHEKDPVPFDMSSAYAQLGGVAFGALAGLMLGTAISLRGHTESVECPGPDVEDPDPAGAQTVVPEPGQR